MTLREAREKAGLTQNELAQRLGVGPSAIGNYEAGRRVPSARRAQEIERVLLVKPGSIDWRLRPEEGSA